MAKHYEMSLLFNFDSPPNLLYAFNLRKGDGQYKSQTLKGTSIANGTFLIEKFIRSNDLLTFALYEFSTTSPVGTISGNRPLRLSLAFENFENTSLFADGGTPIFQPDDFLLAAIPIDHGKSPFPGISNVLRWSTESAQGRIFQVKKLDQDQSFAISAKATVVAERGALEGDQVRTFRFDPEMIIGPDEKGPIEEGETEEGEVCLP